MNCKPDDMAAIVRNTFNSPCLPACMGFVIHVEALGDPAEAGGLAWWTYKGKRLQCTHGNVYKGFYDADLQPIRGLPAGEGESGSRPVVVEGVTEKAGTP